MSKISRLVNVVVADADDPRGRGDHPQLQPGVGAGVQGPLIAVVAADGGVQPCQL